ncbi:uncharacterized protein M6B38_350705 [Iris pallida]|uniref:Ribosomal protein L18 n=1 Tax=Iris pallida TaxID=29817 RepID=A0AAX6GQX5_IRIPA|nr:uncharacterized protein M6B38_350705 [Iris pallida]
MKSNISRFFLLTRNMAIRRTYATTSSDPFRKPLLFESRNDADSTKPATSRLHRPVDLPSLIPTRPARLDGFGIELVDDALWPHSLCGRADAAPPQAAAGPAARSPGPNSVLDALPDMDDIEDLRVRKQLFYKLDRDSKEFEEYNIDFHHRPRKKSSQRKGQERPAGTDLKKERKKPEKPTRGYEVAEKKGAAEKRAKRTPTFNQLTGPYHLPFCLDIYVTKGSVRACVVHRVTSRVVAVAHSISKDLKFDVGSRKDAKACAAVGAVLAQRAVEDDIHNVVYTPRKGDKIEGKLEVVLRAIIDNGVDVKVKLKQRRPVKRTIV